jgi:hypothetical protein
VRNKKLNSLPAELVADANASKIANTTNLRNSFMVLTQSRAIFRYNQYKVFSNQKLTNALVFTTTNQRCDDSHSLAAFINVQCRSTFTTENRLYGRSLQTPANAMAWSRCKDA